MTSVQSANHSLLRSVTGGNVRAIAKMGVFIIGLSVVGKVLYEFYKRAVADQPFGRAPANLSPEAKQYLGTQTPIGGLVSDPKIWSLIRNGFRSNTQQVSDREKNAYIEQMDKVSIRGVPVFLATPKDYQKNDRALVYIHGGAWTLGAPDHLCQIFAPIAYKASLQTYAIDYRLAPEHPFPNGLDDCVEVYKALLEQYAPQNIFFLGDSAGANLCVATILRARDEGLSLPAAAGLHSPLVDAEKNSDTHMTMAGRDPKLSYEKSLVSSIQAYVQSKSLRHPLISVIHADYERGFSPVSIHVGGREVLLGDAARLNEKLHDAGVASSLHVFDGLWHGVQEHGFSDSEQSINRMVCFFRSHFRKE